MAVEVNQLHLKDTNLHDNTPFVKVNQTLWIFIINELYITFEKNLMIFSKY